MTFEPGSSIHSYRPRSRRKYERREALWTAINRLLMVLIVLGLGAALALWIAPELMRRSQLEAELAAKSAELARERALRQKQEKEKFLLENDPEYVETLARDKLELMKPGETIFRITPATNAPASPAGG